MHCYTCRYVQKQAAYMLGIAERDCACCKHSRLHMIVILYLMMLEHIAKGH